MARRHLVAAMLVAGGLGLGGCASQSEVDQLRTDVNALRSDVSAMQNDVRRAVQASEAAAAEARAASERVNRAFNQSLRK